MKLIYEPAAELPQNASIRKTQNIFPCSPERDLLQGVSKGYGGAGELAKGLLELCWLPIDALVDVSYAHI